MSKIEQGIFEETLRAVASLCLAPFSKEYSFEATSEVSANNLLRGKHDALIGSCGADSMGGDMTTPNTGLST